MMRWLGGGGSLFVSTAEAMFKKAKALDADAENETSALMKAGTKLPQLEWLSSRIATSREICHQLEWLSCRMTTT
jgi:hypothetical protein